MNRWIRVGLVAVAALAALAGAAAVTGTQLAEQRMNRQVQAPLVPLAIATDAAAVERGRYLYTTRGCADCHGADAAGRTFVDDGKGMKLAGPAIGRGEGSATRPYRPQDWARTVRHGVKPDGRPVLVMPSVDYNRMTDADLGALVGYVLSLPPTPGRGAVLQMPLPVKAMYGFGVIPDAASRIDHSLPVQQPVAEGVSVEHGRYLAQMCKGCHGMALEGGKVPGGPPDWPAAARLAPGDGSVMAGRYAGSEAFVRMLASGRRPDGSAIAVMPFESLSQLSETDARALHLYLRSLGTTAGG